MLTDPISDMLTRIRNASSARHEVTTMPRSRMRRAIAEILKCEGYIADVREDEVLGKPALTVALKYDDKRCAPFRKIRRVSRPGRRVYVGHGEIPRVLDGLGIAILSTSQGVMTDKEARRRRLGGELLCEVY